MTENLKFDERYGRGTLYRVTFVCQGRSKRIVVVRAMDAIDAYNKAVRHIHETGDTLEYVSSFSVEDLNSTHIVE